ncbi:MAG TPA: glycosyltransferase family 9 protein [Saprospiraceae bacterium]|nr:glycosyltransferase family 9 protein [Saprospiraceae bacterium]
MKAKKILIIRFSSIGDVVLTTPIVRCVKKQLDAEIHFLIKPSFAHVIHENPYIDHIHHLKENIQDTIDILKAEQFDLVIDLQKNLRSYKICSALSCKTIRFDKMNINKWLAVNLKINRLPNGKHLVDRYFESLQGIGVSDDGEGLDYFMMPEDEYDAQELVQGIHYQVLVLGATYFTKRIPKEKCEEIIALYDKHTILLGGKDVAELADQLSTEFPEKVINYCGKIGLGVSAGIVKHADRVVTGDTGMMHIAAALQKKIIMIWGNTIPEFGMFPFYGSKNPSKSIDIQVSNLSCRPCSKLGFDKCPKGHFRCMIDIDISVTNQ